jgi:CRP-like cAMP-binding protein
MTRASSNQDRKLVRLAELPELKTASPRELAAIAAVADSTTLHRGSTIIAANSVVRWVYLIYSGQIASEDTSAHSTAPTVGTFVGDLAAFAGCESPQSVVAVTDVEAFAITKRDFVALLDTAPTVRAALRATLRETLRSYETNVAR